MSRPVLRDPCQANQCGSLGERSTEIGKLCCATFKASSLCAAVSELVLPGMHARVAKQTRGMLDAARWRKPMVDRGDSRGKQPRVEVKKLEASGMKGHGMLKMRSRGKLSFHKARQDGNSEARKHAGRRRPSPPARLPRASQPSPETEGTAPGMIKGGRVRDGEGRPNPAGRAITRVI